MYQALILDMDETLLQSDKTISRNTQHAIITLQQKGIPVILASGRATYGMLKEAQTLQLDKFHSHLIAYNGAEIIQAKNNQIIYQKKFITTRYHGYSTVCLSTSGRFNYS